MINISYKDSTIIRKNESLFVEVDGFDNYFLIKDPFNNTYSPAKNLNIERDGKRIIQWFMDAKERLSRGVLLTE